MAVLVNIPLAYYQAFIGRCYLESREYHVLRNAVIDHVPVHLRDGNVATLFCSEDDATLLLRRAKQFYPIAASYIQEALRSPAYRKPKSGNPSNSSPPNIKTLGDILFADKSNVRLSENEWLELVRAVARGDQRSLHSLFERTYRIVFPLIARITANRKTAEEVTLDVFYEVWQNASSYPANGSVVGWIMNQARSKAIDRLRVDLIPRSFLGRSTDVLRPTKSLSGRLAKRIAHETATQPFLSSLQAPIEPDWEQAATGIHVKILASNRENDSVSMLVRLDPETDYPGHKHAGVEELHLLHGILKVDDRTLHPDDFIQSQAGSVDHRVWTETGCTCFLMTSTKDTLFPISAP
jgi:DNA-directed RNA polymerase specialized sigma24 family protein